MKPFIKFITFLIVLIVVIVRCTKEPQPIQPKDITGQWKWLYTFHLTELSDSNPLTPENSGINEILVFYKDHTWQKKVNNLNVDSGTYSLGHGVYTPYSGAGIFKFDSILYFRDGKTFNDGFDYYEINHDTLHFTPYLGGRFSSYTLPFNGAKYWKKQ